jgi:hypothetical protein
MGEPSKRLRSKTPSSSSRPSALRGSARHTEERTKKAAKSQEPKATTKEGDRKASSTEKIGAKQASVKKQKVETKKAEPKPLAKKAEQKEKKETEQKEGTKKREQGGRKKAEPKEDPKKAEPKENPKEAEPKEDPKKAEPKENPKKAELKEGTKKANRDTETEKKEDTKKRAEKAEKAGTKKTEKQVEPKVEGKKALTAVDAGAKKEQKKKLKVSGKVEKASSCKDLPKKGKNDQEKEQRRAESKDKGKNEETRKKEKKEPPITYVPAKKAKVGHIFDSPTPPAPAPSPSSTTMSKQEKANQKLKELADCLRSSEAGDIADFDSDTDLLEDMAKRKEQEEATEAASDEEMEVGESCEDEDGDQGQDHEEEEQEQENQEEQEEEEDEGEGSDGEGSQVMTEAELTSEDGCVTGEEEGCEKMKPEDFCEEGDEEEEFEADPCVEPAASEPGPVHALVPVTQATADTTLKLRNSIFPELIVLKLTFFSPLQPTSFHPVRLYLDWSNQHVSGTTNKKEYDTFCRQIRSSGKFPVSLSDYCQTNRLDLFNVWLDNGGDWDATKVQVERTQSQKNSTVNGWRAVQGKELRPKYTPEKFAQLVASRRAAGLFYKDDDFPDDEDDAYLTLAHNWGIPIYCCGKKKSYTVFRIILHTQTHTYKRYICPSLQWIKHIGHIIYPLIKSSCALK